MRDELAVWIAASATAISTIGSSVVDVALAADIPDVEHLAPLRALLFVAFSLQIIALGCVAYLALIFTRRRRSVSHQLAWLEPGTGAGFNAVALAVAGAALVWLIVRQNDLSDAQAGLRIAGLVIWAVTIVFHGTFFMLLAIHTRKMLDKTISKIPTTRFGITLPPNTELGHGTRPSFCSKGTTLASRPQTPKSYRTPSLQSSTTKVASSFRSKFARSSARSSLELPPFPAGEATALGNAFDRYDASHVDSETRHSVLNSSPTVTRFGAGLEPIPGSRANSPDDEPTPSPSLPLSPTLRQRALCTPTPAAVQKTNPFDSYPISSSCPPNFSRPTSKSQHRPSISEQLEEPQLQLSTSTSMTDLIHPLFRPDSPHHPPAIMTSGTMVTASPLANMPITPRALSRLRSASDLRPVSPRQGRVMPSIDVVPAMLVSPVRPRSKSFPAVHERTSTVEAEEEATASRKEKDTGDGDSMGSPGPSIVEDDELPPILPGFVLSAGSRSSLVWYGKRKSVKRGGA